jgi:hypothetical protein
MAFISFYNAIWLTINNTIPPWLIILDILIYSLVRVAGVLTILTLAYTYLNKKALSLSYLNNAGILFILSIKRLLLCSLII